MLGAYDAHDKLTSGTSGNEADGYDANGNETSVTIGGGTYRYTYDDEDRLTSITTPSGTDTFTYNGLGLRVTKTDSTGSYAYVCDGTSPGSPVLTDGAALYTPGLSEYRGGASRYYANDKRGNLWTIDASSKGQLDYQDTTGFGTLVAQAGSSSPFGYGGGNGCQTDADTGLILMGHRYFDTRIGRFISQDPIGAGDNWYAYADNSPTNEVDPLGLDGEDGPASQQAGPTDGSGQGIPPTGYYDDGTAYWDMPNGGRMYAYPPSAVGTASTDASTSSGGLLDGVGGAFGVGFSAVGSALSGGLWNGGAARHDPSFGTSKTLANIGIAAGGAALGGVAAVGKAAEETVTVARWGREGLESGDWVMKGPATRWNYIFSFKWQRGFGNEFSPFKAGNSFEVPGSSVKWPTGAGIDGWWKGLFGQRIYMP